MSAAATPVVAAGPARAVPGRASILSSALRSRQWTKNALVFAGLIFARRFDEPQAWLDAVAAFVAFCALSSAAYLVNDVRDAEHDALHPTKRTRPVASGELAPRSALVLAAGLAVGGIGVAAALGTGVLLAALAFVALQVGYSFWIKRIVLLDVAAIAALFVLRAMAGAEAVTVSISAWLLACTALLALFLGLAKRRAELRLVAAGTTSGRAVLRRYSLVVVERLVVLAAAATLAVYVAYALLGPTAAMAATVPFVVAGLVRYLRLSRRDLGEAPEEILLTDPVVRACVGGWVLTAAVVLVTT